MKLETLNWLELDKLYHHHDVVPIAFQGVKSFMHPYEIFVYHCITKKPKKTQIPYHLGTFSPDLSVACVNCYERNYNLHGRKWWFQEKPTNTEAFKQWMDWTWRDDRERMLFNEWLDERFGRDISTKSEPVQLTL